MQDELVAYVGDYIRMVDAAEISRGHFVVFLAGKLLFGGALELV